MGSVLCLTYTNAAAAEIKERIRAALQEFVVLSDDDLTTRLQEIQGCAPNAADSAAARDLFFKYIDNMDTLKIQTMHGFCQEILRRFPLEAGVDPSWSLLTELERAKMIDSAFDALMKNTDDAELKDALEYIMPQMTEWGMNGVKNLVAGLYKDFFSLDFDIKNAAQFIETIRKTFTAWDFDEAAFLSAERMKFRQIYGARLIELNANQTANKVGMAMTQFAAGAIDFSEYKSVFINKSIERNGNINKLSENKLGAEIKIFISAEQTELYNCAQIDAQEELLRGTAALYILAAKFAAEFRQVKDNASRLDYDDLILYTTRLFQSQEMMGWVMSQLDSRVRHLMVDEAQDTSPGQWDIIQSLLTDFFHANSRASLFVVGDPKQSIYSFQGASIASFFAANEYTRKMASENMSEIMEIDLQKSYRTAQVLLDAVDYFFNLDSINNLTKLKSKTHHLSGRDGAVGKIVLHKVFQVETADEEDEVSSDERNKMYANEIAARIKSMLESDATLRPEDIMVLVKKRNPHANNLIAALEETGIPVAGKDRMELARALPVMDLLAVIKFCIDNSDDFSLAAALTSPLFEMGQSELFNLCRGRGQDSLFSQIDGNLRETLDEIIKWSRELGPYSFLMKLLDTDGRRENMLRRMGAAAYDAMQEFLTLALAAERTRAGGLVQFLDWFMQGESTIKRDMQAASGVRIMTAFGAKGLESRVVLLIDTTSTRGKMDAARVIPIGRKHWIWGANDVAKSGADYVATKEKSDDLDRQEYYRLLYVAMTRARDELHIFGCAGKTGAGANSWYETLAAALPDFPGAENTDDCTIIKG